MVPIGNGTPRTIMANVQIADVNVKVLIDSGAMSSGILRTR